MARTRSRGLQSPKTPTSGKSKKVGAIRDSPIASPSVQKTKKIDSSKSASKEKKKIVETKEAEKIKEPKTKILNSEKVDGSIVPNSVALKAINALAKFASENHASESNKASLFEDEDKEEENTLYLQINTKKFYSSKPQFKPKLIKLTNSIYDLENVRTCLIIRDQLITEKEQLEEIEGAEIPTLSQIYSLTQIKTEFKAYEKRRELFSNFDLFVVDDALLNLMPTVLGKIFYGNSSNKTPLPIRVCASSNLKEISVTTIKNQIVKCLSSTHFLPPMGVTVSIKFGKINNDQKSLIANLNDVLSTFDDSSIKSIMMKTSASPSLPLFYTKSLYGNDDVISEDKSDKSSTKSDEVRLSTFERGLLELGAVDEVSKIIGKKLNKQNKQQKPSGKISKPTKRSK